MRLQRLVAMVVISHCMCVSRRTHCVTTRNQQDGRVLRNPLGASIGVQQSWSALPLLVEKIVVVFGVTGMRDWLR